VGESEGCIPQTVDKPDQTANVSDKFVDDVDCYCNPEEGV
jgi:hypothetical protein